MLSPLNYGRKRHFDRLRTLRILTMFSLNYSTVIDPLLWDVRLYVPKFSGMKAGDKVLDVCCGTGDQVFHYSQRGINAVGVDLNPDMIQLAERNKMKLGLTNASFKIADARDLPFQDSLFDHVSISLALHEIERTGRDKVVSEMRRVVRKDGALIFIDFQIPLPKNLYAYLAKVIEFMAGRRHHSRFRDFIEEGGLDRILKQNQLPEENRGYLKAGIITIIKTRNV